MVSVLSQPEIASRKAHGLCVGCTTVSNSWTVFFWNSMSLSVMRGLRSTLGFVDFELLDAAVLGVVERLSRGLALRLRA